MKQELIDMLLEYYGELMQERDSIGVHNFSKNQSIIEQMDAINILLDISEFKNQKK